ncbi:MAG: hypothetical protein ACRDRU_07415 [Pseudonocardiaceae bacterium]
MFGRDTPGPDLQQDDLAVRAEQHGAQRTESGALTGVDWSLAVLAGICGSGRRGGGATDASPSRAAPPPGPVAGLIPEPPLGVPAAGRWIRWGRGPPGFVQANPRVPATPGGTLGAS